MAKSSNLATQSVGSSKSSTLKRRLNEVGLEYGVLVDAKNLDRVKCLLCRCAGRLCQVKCIELKRKLLIYQEILLPLLNSPQVRVGANISPNVGMGLAGWEVGWGIGVGAGKYAPHISRPVMSFHFVILFFLPKNKRIKGEKLMCSYSISRKFI